MKFSLLLGLAVLLSSIPSFALPIGSVVLKDQNSAKFCVESKIGSPCLTSWSDAVEFCNSLGQHLPTGREFLGELLAQGTVIYEKADAGSVLPDQSYLVESINPDGGLDAFYMNHSNFQSSNRDAYSQDLLLWTSSRPPQHLDFAHVLYTKWGGGGGSPHEHHLSFKNAVRCAAGLR